LRPGIGLIKEFTLGMDKKIKGYEKKNEMWGATGDCIRPQDFRLVLVDLLLVFDANGVVYQEPTGSIRYRVGHFLSISPTTPTPTVISRHSEGPNSPDIIGDSNTEEHPHLVVREAAFRDDGPSTERFYLNFAFTNDGPRSIDQYVARITTQAGREPEIRDFSTSNEVASQGGPVGLRLPVNREASSFPIRLALVIRYRDKLTRRTHLQEWYFVWRTRDDRMIDSMSDEQRHEFLQAVPHAKLIPSLSNGR
jgi:hypothetical protein